jgi:deoxyribodipyrimidine photolyase-related protein
MSKAQKSKTETIKSEGKEIVLIYPHQLYEYHPALHKSRVVVLVEEYLFFKQYKFHKQKLILHRASMKAFQAKLEAEGYEVFYIDSQKLLSSNDVFTNIHKKGYTHIHYMDVVDDWLSRAIQKAAVQYSISLTCYESLGFYLNSADIEELRQKYSKSKTILFNSFYIAMRKKFGVLLEEGLPIGGSWNFDKENRKKLPEDVEVPAAPVFQNAYIVEATEYIERNFAENYGSSTMSMYVTTHEEANKALHLFCKERLALFGDYEDAIDNRTDTLFHSNLSHVLNCGLITPQQVIETALTYAKKYDTPLNSLEGFVRQVLGWREFIRVMYCIYGRTMRTRNFFNHKKHIPESMWLGTTGIDPLDDVITKVLRTGYAHHIERLMIVGNYCLLSRLDPDQVYRWFMELFIDAYDWVMVPNVYGMSQFADGGIFATKPYISASAYIKKMSNYKAGKWSEVWDAKYWLFIDDNQELFRNNHRMSMMLTHLKSKNIGELRKMIRD